MPGSKRKAQEKHAKRRFLERYGKVVGRKTLELLADMIQAGEMKFIQRQSNRITVWEYTDEEGRAIQVVYDKKRKTIVTVLPAKETA